LRGRVRFLDESRDTASGKSSDGLRGPLARRALRSLLPRRLRVSAVNRLFRVSDANLNRRRRGLALFQHTLNLFGELRGRVRLLDESRDTASGKSSDGLNFVIAA